MIPVLANTIYKKPNNYFSPKDKSAQNINEESLKQDEKH